MSFWQSQKSWRVFCKFLFHLLISTETVSSHSQDSCLGQIQDEWSLCSLSLELPFHFHPQCLDFLTLFFSLSKQNALAVQTKSTYCETLPSPPCPPQQQVIISAFQKGLLRRYLHAQDSTVMLGYTLRTTFLFSSKNKILREDILSGMQQGSGMPGTTPTALTMLWMVAWLDGFKACKRKVGQKM